MQGILWVDRQWAQLRWEGKDAPLLGAVAGPGGGGVGWEVGHGEKEALACGLAPSMKNKDRGAATVAVQSTCSLCSLGMSGAESHHCD